MLSEEKKNTGADAGRSGKPDRIILTGFRGTGKSLVGSGLAEQLGLDFIDTDALLSDEMQCSLAEFVHKEGWDAFRFAEQKILEKLVHVKKAVIATGGGAILHHDVWQDLRKNGLVIWLQAEPGTIRRRLEQDESSAGQRPALTGSSMTGEVDDVLAFRQPYYEQGSDVAIDTTKMSPEDIIEYIRKLLTGEATQ